MTRSKPREDTLEALTVAMCADYDRRAEAIASATISPRVRMEYRYLNTRIYGAACEMEPEQAEIFIREIGSRTGYAHTAVQGMSEGTYKSCKRYIFRRIQEVLHMVDPPTSSN